MQRFSSIFPVVTVLFCMLLIAGCAPKMRSAAVPRPEGKLAVAGFSNPVYNWQILAGYLAEEGHPVPDGTVETLDAVLVDTLARHQVFDYITPAAVKQCEDVVVFEESGLPKVSAWKYWLGVGKCIQADYLLVPQITYWRERVGSDAGVQTPASVALDFYLIDVKNERMTRSRYEETQESLLENLFTARKFAKRGGKWVTATRLASDGIEEKLMELGL
ncbi:putative lipoprotein [Pseudodesulfovibrio piezophilus C1TLV30]|uniref:Putative lipoprotein n=2 Tax=Pseudodesulfovibrio TaxID=2035811 RepID=M1WUA4_PSEP2|nr:putative lipoprotein [Pseudodesulfovibrio piezophilus C1TLV30]